MPNRFPVPPLSWADSKEHLRKLALAVQGLMRGQSNNLETVTLTPEETTTELLVDGVTANTAALLSPRSASAAAAIGSVWTECTSGVVVIHHDADPATDRNFSITLVG